MATDMGNFQKTKNIIWPIIWKRDAKRGTSKESMIGSCEIMFSVNGWFENNRDEEVCRAWDVLAEQDHTYRMSEAEHFHYRQNWWISLNKSGNDTQPVRKRSDFNQALSTLNRLHQEAGGQQLGPIPYWKYKQWRPASSSSSSLVAMARILVVFLRIQRK